MNRVIIAVLFVGVISLFYGGEVFANHDTAAVNIISAVPNSGFLPLNVVFTSSGMPTSDALCAPETYSWDFGDFGPPGAGANVNHVYVTPGIFTATVTYTMEDNHGASVPFCQQGMATAQIRISVERRLGEIHGTKFHDLNANGTRDFGEPGLDGWEIDITGLVVNGASTDFLGNYWFTELPDGVYSVCETIAGQEIDQQSVPNAGINCPNGTKGYSVDTAGGQIHTNIDFGNFQNGEIHGRKVVRTGREGETSDTCPEGTEGCAGVVIVLDGTDGMGNEVNIETVTDANGSFWYMDVKPGMYTISVQEPIGFVCIFPVPCEHVVELESGEIIEGLDFIDEPGDDDGGGDGGEQETAELNLFINEVMWSGTDASSEDQWLELLNLNDFSLGLDGWRLVATWEEDGVPMELIINLGGEISARNSEDRGLYLLEQGDDDVVLDVDADLIYDGLLPLDGARIELQNPEGAVVDTANNDRGPWPAGSRENDEGTSMERDEPHMKPELDELWHDNNQIDINGFDRNNNEIDGTPRQDNSPEPTEMALHVQVVLALTLFLGMPFLVAAVRSRRF